MIRRVLERFARDTSIRRRLPSAFGRRPLFLSADSALSYLRPNWSRASSTLLEAAKKYCRGAKSVWDIGANCGVFTFAAAHVAAPNAGILAVEPDVFLATLLKRSVSLPENFDLHVHVLCAAVSEVQDVARFLIASRGRSSNALEATGHRSEAGGTRQVCYVPTVTLDGLLSHFAKPDLIKIDVEGAENLVLKGGREILSTVRPMIYIEVGAKQNADVTSMFRMHGYRIYDGDRDDSKVMEACAYNTLAVPMESERTNC